MRDAAPRPINLKDTPPAFLISNVDMDVDIRDRLATVNATLRLRATRQAPGGPLVLDGRDLELVSVSIDKRTLAAPRRRRTSRSGPGRLHLGPSHASPGRTPARGLYATRAGGTNAERRFAVA